MTALPDHIASARHFAANGYTVVRSAIPREQQQVLFGFVEAAYGGVVAPEGDEIVPGTPWAYGDFLGEKLLARIQPTIEAAVGLSLFPTYSYLRLYKNGDRLKRHTDRPACEISASLCLGYKPDLPWPIWVEVSATPVPITLQRGDMLIYRGIDVPHWRDTYAGQRVAQVFLHYVDQNGPHVEWKFDRRPGLHAPAVARR
jgi:hypothetical protein